MFTMYLLQFTIYINDGRRQRARACVSTVQSVHESQQWQLTTYIHSIHVCDDSVLLVGSVCTVFRLLALPKPRKTALTTNIHCKLLIRSPGSPPGWPPRWPGLGPDPLSLSQHKSSQSGTLQGHWLLLTVAACGGVRS